ncbi:hypothetical protein [Streptomyces sp. NBC_00648]|uniref:hypothetical protein n=1 Tax=Streptomyces sp. NBC_00648 TaxID=2975797 RepID=UPI0032510D35
MTAELASTLLSDQYAARVAADLETNTHGQTRIRGEIEALQAQLATLEVDSVLLTLIRDALSSSLPAVTPAKEAAPDRVKPSSKGGPAASSPAQRAPKPGSPAGLGRDKKSPLARASRARATAVTRPRLGDLVLALFTHQEPRTASDVVRELGAAHPDRAQASTQVVRNTVEALVAKCKLARERTQRTVHYTAPRPVTTAAEPVAATPAAVTDLPA